MINQPQRNLSKTCYFLQKSRLIMPKTKRKKTEENRRLEKFIHYIY